MKGKAWSEIRIARPFLSPYEVANGPPKAEPRRVVRICERDQPRQRFGMTPTHKRAQELVAPRLRPGEHVLKLAEPSGPSAERFERMSASSSNGSVIA